MLENPHNSAQHQLFRIQFTELNEIFLVMSLRTFVSSMIGIFIPIYLYVLGYSLRDIFVMHLIMFAIELAFEFITTQFMAKYGPKHAMSISLPLLIAHFWLLSTLPLYHWPLWFIAAAGGISLSLYWQGYHYDFSRAKHKGEATKDVSKLYIILALLGAVAPFIGGVIATQFKIQSLYMLVIILLMFVFIPMLKRGEKHLERKIDLRRVNISEIKLDLLSYAGFGIEAVAAITIWPLFVFLIVGSYQNVGFVTSIALLLSVIVMYFVGKRVNDRNRSKYIKTGSFLDAIIYSLVILVDSFVKVVFINVARSVVGALRTAPYVSEYYLHADEKSRSEYIFYMESVIDVGKMAVFAILILLTYVTAPQWCLFAGLFCGAAGSLVAGLMPRAKSEIRACKGATIKVTPKLRPRHETNR